MQCRACHKKRVYLNKVQRCFHSPSSLTKLGLKPECRTAAGVAIEIEAINSHRLQLMMSTLSTKWCLRPAKRCTTPMPAGLTNHTTRRSKEAGTSTKMTTPETNLWKIPVCRDSATYQFGKIPVQACSHCIIARKSTNLEFLLTRPVGSKKMSSTHSARSPRGASRSSQASWPTSSTTFSSTSTLIGATRTSCRRRSCCVVADADGDVDGVGAPAAAEEARPLSEAHEERTRGRPFEGDGARNGGRLGAASLEGCLGDGLGDDNGDCFGDPFGEDFGSCAPPPDLLLCPLAQWTLAPGPSPPPPKDWPASLKKAALRPLVLTETGRRLRRSMRRMVGKL
mmetsp:Transcript_1731/g.6777  ORF Transcript_1731/g.6777 Transcript_1731/m.6777 type:complete len:339 (-) Transcript_1731:472-1488(-)